MTARRSRPNRTLSVSRAAVTVGGDGGCRRGHHSGSLYTICYICYICYTPDQACSGCSTCSALDGNEVSAPRVGEVFKVVAALHWDADAHVLGLDAVVL